MSYAYKFVFVVCVRFVIPPIFIKLIGILIFSFWAILFEINLWNIGASGAPWPPLIKSFSLKLLITIFFVNCDNNFPSPNWIDNFSSELWKIVCPWKPIKSISSS